MTKRDVARRAALAGAAGALLAPAVAQAKARSAPSGQARKLQELLDRDEIRQLATRYSFALDTNDFDAVRELLAPNAVMFGKTDYAQWFTLQRSLPEGWGGHFISNHQIDFVDDTHAQGL